MKKVEKRNSDFRTHIQEPRWQQIVSVVLVTLLVIGWLLVVRGR